MAVLQVESRVSEDSPERTSEIPVVGGGRDGFYLGEPIQNRLNKSSEYSTVSILKLGS